ncbi:hypothetical protein QVD17_12391 [Tagetes erecta]|uniref:Uncharacterized protein n=1 Tax=Tagetes erecta TaxID=13708 RepID=A0AAD8NVM2_TARER|nr:hypothetical protein QVD17_12391 [Tagetes erecta]
MAMSIDLMIVRGGKGGGVAGSHIRVVLSRVGKMGGLGNRLKHVWGCNGSFLVRVKLVGDFYEAIGFDACILVEYAGLNPCGGLRSDSVPKAGCPVVNLRQTLDDMTRYGFSVFQSVRLELEKERARENLENRLEQLEKNLEEEREQARVVKEKERAEREKLQKQMNDILERIG